MTAPRQYRLTTADGRATRWRPFPKNGLTRAITRAVRKFGCSVNGQFRSRVRVTPIKKQERRR